MPRRLHRVEFSWFETKTYPIATHLDARSTWNLSRRTKATRPRAEHHSKFKSHDRRWLLGSIGWGEPKAKRKHCTRTPFVRFFFRCRLFGSLLFREGKVTCVPVVLETERCSVTQTRTPHSKRSRVSPWHHIGRRHCVSCWTRVRAWLLWCERVCVCEQSDRVSSECDENFQFQNGDRRFFATCVFGFFGRWEYVSRWRLRQSLAP